jgi:uncharacterized protein
MVGLRSLEKFSSLLKMNSGSGLRWDWKYHKDETHGSVRNISIIEGLKFLYSDFNLPLEILTTSGPERIVKHYGDVSQKMGYSVVPDEELIEWLAYLQLNKVKDTAMAIGFLELNIKNYPDRPSVFVSLATCLKTKEIIPWL